LRRLRKEVWVLKEEREILKKVTASARKTSNGSGSVESAAVPIGHLKGVFHRIIRDSSLLAFMRQVMWTKYHRDEGRPECLV
jgi:hypothetical protein